LNQAEIRELIKAGWEIGSHGVSHHELTGMPIEQMMYELRHSKEYLESTFYQPVRLLAAPFGRVNSRVIKAIEQIGYTHLCTFFPFKYRHNRPPAAIIPRLAVYSTDTLNMIGHKVTPQGANWLEVLKQNVINFCANATLVVRSIR